MRLPAHLVEIRSEDADLKITALLGQEAPQLTGGVGGWEAVNRPNRRPLSVWRGVQEPLRMVLPLLLDKWDDSASGRSVEAECRVLERMGGLDRNDPEPPILIVEGSLPHDESRAKSNRWVIEGLEWGDALRRAEDGHRVRQEVTVTLMLFVQDDKLSRIRRGSSPGGRSRYVKARNGDTFEKIAHRELGSGRYGLKLARLNGKRSAGTHIKVGTRVKLPTASVLKSWK